MTTSLYYKQGTHRVRIHTVLLITITLTITYTTPKPYHVYSISCNKVISNTKFEWDLSFLSYAPNKQMKNALIDLVTLAFDLLTPKHVTSRISQGHSLHQV